MLSFIAARQMKIVVCVSCSRSRDGTHEHVTALTVRSATGQEHRVTASDVAEHVRHPLGQRYAARSHDSSHYEELVAGLCPYCHEHVSLRLASGARIEDLPRCR